MRSQRAMRRAAYGLTGLVVRVAAGQQQLVPGDDRGGAAAARLHAALDHLEVGEVALVEQGDREHGAPQRGRLTWRAHGTTVRRRRPARRRLAGDR